MSENVVKINLCCGNDYREGYINVDWSDVASDHATIKVDLTHDVLTGLPWEDDSVDELVFREALEHFNREQGYRTLLEIARVLKPGGKLDLSVPNAPRQLKILLTQINKKITLESWLDPHTPPWSYGKYHEDLMGATHFDSKGDSHLTLYTENTLRILMEGVGLRIEEYSVKSSLNVIARK